MKEKILDVAAKLIQQYGLKKFTVDEIASQLKISKKTIYKYFESKDDLIRSYFNSVISSDEESIKEALKQKTDFFEKISSIVHSSHKYTLPINLINEAQLFYPEEWEQVEQLKIFKLNAMKGLLEEGKSSGIIKPDINFAVLCRMLEKISDTFIDYDFLLDNNLKSSAAIDEALKIMLHGILKDK
jgi:AcrR family transcriptional regulator